MSARLQANVFDLGGMDSNLTFQWGTDANLTSPETPMSMLPKGLHSILLNNLNTSTTYFYRAKLVNSRGFQWDAISVKHAIGVNDTGTVALDQGVAVNGIISGATTIGYD